MNQPIGVWDEAGRALRASLITEETKETMDAIANRNMLETIDGLCDCLYVGVGGAVAFGFALADYYPERSEPLYGMLEPRIVDAEDAIALLSGAQTGVVAAINEESLHMTIASLVGYVAILFGVADRFCIPIRAFWDEVHRSNLEKADGPVRSDGKRLKPPGWTPPDLRRVYVESFGRVPT